MIALNDDVPCSWTAKAEPDGPLPPFVESSYFQNKRVRLKRGDVVQVKPCEETVRGSGGNATRYCCSTPNDGCLPAHDSLRLDTALSQEAHVQFLQVRIWWKVMMFCICLEQQKGSSHLGLGQCKRTVSCHENL